LLFFPPLPIGRGLLLISPLCFSLVRTLLTPFPPTPRFPPQDEEPPPTFLFFQFCPGAPPPFFASFPVAASAFSALNNSRPVRTPFFPQGPLEIASLNFPLTAYLFWNEHSSSVLNLIFPRRFCPTPPGLQFPRFQAIAASFGMEGRCYPVMGFLFFLI